MAMAPKMYVSYVVVSLVSFAKQLEKKERKEEEEKEQPQQRPTMDGWMDGQESLLVRMNEGPKGRRQNQDEREKKHPKKWNERNKSPNLLGNPPLRFPKQLGFALSLF